MDLDLMIIRCEIGSRRDCCIVEEVSIIFPIHRRKFLACEKHEREQQLSKARSKECKIPDEAYCPVDFTPYQVPTKSPVLRKSDTDDHYCVPSASVVSRFNHSSFRIPQCHIA